MGFKIGTKEKPQKYIFLTLFLKAIFYLLKIKIFS